MAQKKTRPVRPASINPGRMALRLSGLQQQRIVDPVSAALPGNRSTL
ncbi:hypothetical protein GTA77_000761 [Salmonella enterica subsp. enterica]|nr:hypothetical protein [Salmonella enterica subsp. enterica]